MNSECDFDYDRFEALEGLELCSYMEPLLLLPTLSIASDDLNSMRQQLQRYDEYHLVYALLLGAKYSPETFRKVVPSYLVDSRSSVLCTAVNILSSISDNQVTEELVSEVHKYALTQPDTSCDREGYLRPLSSSVWEVYHKLKTQLPTT